MSTMAQIDPTLIEEIQGEERERFRAADLDHPAIQEIFNICTTRKIIEAGDGRRVSNNEYLDIDIDSYSIPEHMETDLSFLESIIKDVKLPTLPDIVLKIQQVIRDPNSSAYDMAEVISMDASLSSTILKIANSAFYNFQSEVDTLYRAVAIVGTQQLSALTHGIKIIDAFKGVSPGILNMKSFWKHSIACGINARIIAYYKGLRSSERLFMAGLLHDVARLVLHNYASTISIYMLVKSRQSGRLVRYIEKETMQFDHAEIAGMILNKWNLPLSLEDTIAHHHTPGAAHDRMEASIIHLADLLANAIALGSSGEYLVPPLDPAAWDTIGLPTDVLPVIVSEGDAQVAEVLSFFLSSSTLPDAVSH
jgi:HD-like signal output (HDOD) protein